MKHLLWRNEWRRLSSLRFWSFFTAFRRLESLRHPFHKTLPARRGRRIRRIRRIRIAFLRRVQYPFCCGAGCARSGPRRRFHHLQSRLRQTCRTENERLGFRTRRGHRTQFALCPAHAAGRKVRFGFRHVPAVKGGLQSRLSSPFRQCGSA